MNVDNFEKRQAITEWRDCIQLAAWALVNECGKKARILLEEKLHEAGIQNSLMDPSHFAHTRVDNTMRASLEAELTSLGERASKELHDFDPSFGALSDLLISHIAQLIYPNTIPPKINSQEPTQETPLVSFKRQRLSAIQNFVTNNDILKGARELGAKALDQINEVAGAASHQLQDTTGLYDRLRRAAEERITRAWLSDRGDDRSLMAQLIVSINDIASQARSMAL